MNVCRDGDSDDDLLQYRPGITMEQEQVESWFAGEDPRDPSAVLKRAYESAKKYFDKNTGKDDSRKSWLEDRHSLRDVQDVVEEARRLYESRPTSKVFNWLARFSKKVKYYGTVLDVLAQQHPEYVSLVWGAFKVIFGAVINHEDQIEQLAKACTQIADILPRVELTLKLYQTNLMLKAVTDLYVSILEFLRHAVKWYKQGKLGHTWTAIAKPWELGFRDYVEDISTNSRRIEQLASTSSQAELRATHLETSRIRKELRATKIQVDKLIQMAYQTCSLQNQIQIDLTSSKAAISRIELNQMLSLPFLSYLPTSGETMNHCRTMRNRRQSRLKLPAPSIGQFEAWSKDRACSFAFTQSHSNQTSKDFLVDLVDIIQEAKFPTIWALRFEDFWKRSLTSTDLLKMLIIQSLQVNHGVLTASSYPPTVASLRDAVDEKDWLSILNRTLHGVPVLYIVLDADIVGYAMRYNTFATTRLLELFPRIVSSTIIKIVVSETAIDEGYTRRNWDLFDWTKVNIDNISGKRKTGAARSVARWRVKRRRI